MLTIFANLFNIAAGPQVVQFQFLNQFQDKAETVSVAQIALSRADAQALVDVLGKLLADTAK